MRGYAVAGTPRRSHRVLHAVQEAFGYLEPDVLEYVGNALGVPLSRVYGVATFYSLFMLKPQGAHTVVVCTGTACYINQLRRSSVESMSGWA